MEEIKQCNFVNVNDLNQWEQQTSLKVSSFDDLKQNIIAPINDWETVEDSIKQNVDPFPEKDTDVGKTNMIKMSIDTGNHPPIILRPYRMPLVKHLIVDKAVNNMLATILYVHPDHPGAFLYSGHWQNGCH